MTTPRILAGDAERHATLDTLRRAHLEGRLDPAEFEQRQTRALAARYLDDLSLLVGDLPGPNTPVTGPIMESRSPEVWHQPPALRTTQVPAGQVSGGNLPMLPGSSLPWSLTVMSGRTVELPPGSPGLRNVAWWGGDDIDVSDAMGPGRVVVLELHAVMAGSTIWVPAGVRIVDESLAIMAGNSISREVQGDGSNGTVILRGFLWWGGHAVKRAKPRTSARVVGRSE